MRTMRLLKLGALYVSLFVLSSVAMAQSAAIKGTVKDVAGNPIIGASVVVSGTTNGTVTNISGDYTITAPSNATLNFNYIGYVAQNVQVAGRTTIDIVLAEDTKTIDEVVVVGYGTQRKSDLTGSVASVNIQDMLTTPTTDVGSMLRGRVAGVEVTQSSARPGGTSDILIRGKRSLSAENSPLYIVDGVPADNIDDLNANDIKSIEVLKDASSQAIYGARAAAGVVLITTMRGSVGKLTVDVSAQYSVQTQKRNFELMNGNEFIGMLLAQDGIYGGVANATEDQIQNSFQGDEILFGNYKKGRQTDWDKILLRPASQQQYNVSVRGGSENTKVMSSFNYFKQDGMIKNTGYQRGTIRLNVDQKISKKVSIGANISYNRNEQKLEDGAEGGSSTSGGSLIMQNATVLSPWSAPYDEDGKLLRYVTETTQKYNPLWNIDQASDIKKGNNLSVNVFGEWDIWGGIKYRVNGSFRYNDVTRDSYETKEHEQGSKKGGWGQFVFDKTNDWLIENILTYNKNFTEDHRFDVTLVQSANKMMNSVFEQSAQNFLTDYFGADGIASAGTINVPKRKVKPRQIASFMGRVRYAMYDKYMFTASLRIDGSSVFGPSHKWGYFPSAALAWRVNQEDFLKHSTVVSNLKLRFSYGEVGNQGVGPYMTAANTDPYQMLFGGSQAGFQTGLLPTKRLANPDLKWEKTASYNIGVDFGFLNERFTGSIEYYDMSTSDLLVARTLSSATGYADQMVNLGKVNNRGVEVTLGARIIQTKDWYWDANLTFSRNKNKIVAIDGKLDSAGKPLDQPLNNWYIGRPMDIYYDYKFDGIFNNIDEVRNSPQGKDPANGNALSDADLAKKVGHIRVQDLDGNGIITVEDKGFYYRQPKWIGSLTTTLQWRGIDLLIDLYTSQGAIRRNSYMYDYNQGGTYSSVNLNGIKRNYWTPEGLGQEAPIPAKNATDVYQQTLGYQDASYFRIRTIQLGYTLPKKWLNKAGISNVKVFATLSNYFTWTDFMSFSPEAGPSSYPEPRTATFGLNFSF